MTIDPYCATFYPIAQCFFAQWDIVAIVVREKMDKKSATAFIRKQAKNIIPDVDQMKFIEVVETELMNLHEGNISRYGVNLPEFDQWRQGWF